MKAKMKPSKVLIILVMLTLVEVVLIGCYLIFTSFQNTQEEPPAETQSTHVSYERWQREPQTEEVQGTTAEEIKEWNFGDYYSHGE